MFRLSEREIDLWKSGSIIKCAESVRDRLNRKKDFNIAEAIDIAEMWMKKQKDLEDLFGKKG